MKNLHRCLSLILLFLLAFELPGLPLWAGNGAYRYHLPAKPYGVDPEAITVIGAARDYVVQKDDTLLDIAPNFDLGFSEIQVPYKDIDP
jgi:hypothetical protein